MINQPYYLAGRWISDGRELEVYSPATGDVVGVTYRPPGAAADEAVAEAKKAFPGMKEMPVYRKAEILKRIASDIEKNGHEMAELIAMEAGKPLRFARVEVSRAVQTFTEAAEECSRIYGEILPLDVSPAAGGKTGITALFPIGPVLAITPFNFPLNLVAHKLAPAIAAGCPVILKPSSETPLTALMLACLVDEAGAPPGALSVLPLEGSAAESIATMPGIRKVTFTGSAEVGWRLKRAAWDKRVTLELGGNAAVVLHNDWGDIDAAAERIAVGGYAYAGQVCISIQRIYVHREKIDRFMETYLEKVRALVVGDPLAEGTVVGPMITEREAERVEEWVEEAVKAGAVIAAGGRRDGSYYHPTVITGARRGMKVVDEEMFGPVTAVFVYDDFDEAVREVNESRFGLQAGVYTRDISIARRAFNEIEAGGVIIGDIPTFRVDRMPYGGVKQSGFGREGLRYSIREMCETKLLVLSR